jgi:hypothetical protein
MVIMKNYPIVNVFGIYTAISTFILGIVLLFIYSLTYSPLFNVIGVIYLFIAIFVNLTILIFQVEGKKILPALLILLNIPIGLFFFYLHGTIDNTLKINLINKTNCRIAKVEIINCSNSKHIDYIEIDEEYAFHNIINYNCTISMSYEINNQIINDTIVEIRSYLDKDQHEIRYRIGIDKTIVLFNDSD